jgi:uncharacterized RDD family membrane protein YckC
MNYKPRKEYHTEETYMLASIWKRSLAFFIDWIIILLLYFGLIVILSFCHVNITSVTAESIFDVEIESNISNTFYIVLLKFVFGFLPMLYFTFSFFLLKGRTVGKYIFRIRVISLHHEKLGLWHSLERSLGYFASAVEFGLGYMQALWNPNRMSLHDKIGETVVIKLPRKRK